MENSSYKTPRLTRSQSKLIQNSLVTPKNVDNKENFGSFGNDNLEKSVQGITEELRNVSIKTPKMSRTSSIRIKHLNSVVDKKSSEIVGREKEIRDLSEFVMKNISEYSNANIYISGTPGTGKTFVVTEVMNRLVKRKMCEFHFINCMDLANPGSGTVYREMLFKATGKLCNTNKAAAEMEIFLRTRSRDSAALIFVLDEIDQLILKNESILYRILNWTEMTKSRFTIIGIANSLDLVERMLPNLTLQTCRPHCMNFPPYNKEEITAIISSRIGGTLDEKQKFSVQYCSRKASAQSGDARAALDLYKRAEELSELDELQALRSESVDRGGLLEEVGNIESPPIRRVLSTPQLLARKMSMRTTIPSSPSIKHVNRAISEVQRGADPFRNIINSESGKSTLPLHQKLALCAGLVMSRRRHRRNKPPPTTTASTRKQILRIGELHDLYDEICRSENIESIDMANFIDITVHLESRGIVRVQPHNEPRQRIFAMNLDRKSTENALNDEMLLTSIMRKFLPDDDDDNDSL